MAALNKKDSTEKQIEQITSELRKNGTIISQIAENIEGKRTKKATRLVINPSLN